MSFLTIIIFKGKMKGYQFIEDEELGTLKVDFSTLLTFDVNDLEKAK
ncbi:MAG: hypothetical protein K9G70_11300 [Prolixibacteraceae bacterium]|nr:hypothetical protein [Prolixibacteraceae bacterium]